MPIIIGILMIFATFLRTNASIRQATTNLLVKKRALFHFLNAILHGFSNLGGILLTFYSSSVYKDKVRSMNCTATFYLIYAISQLILLFCVGKGIIFQAGLFYVPLTALLHLFLGQETFRVISQKQFDTLATVFFFFAGTLFLCRPVMI
jgi:hypothetical protein